MFSKVLFGINVVIIRPVDDATWYIYPNAGLSPTSPGIPISARLL